MPDPTSRTDRQSWMAVLARASAAELAVGADLLPGYTTLRGPEAGLVMVQGRAGGTGGAFNLGEATAARCSVAIEGGQVGHAYRLGRDLRAAELAAVIDAALQDPVRHEALQARLIRPLAAAQAEAKAETARKAAATQVQFFTMATMRG